MKRILFFKCFLLINLIVKSQATISFVSSDTTIFEASPTAIIYAKLTATSSAASSLSLTISKGVYFIEGTIDSKKEIKRLIIVD